MKTVKPNKEHQQFRDDLIEVMRKYENLPTMELLAIASHFVGQLVALQDQSKITPPEAMAVVATNIEAGNRQVIAELVEIAAVGRA